MFMTKDIPALGTEIESADGVGDDGVAEGVVLGSQTTALTLLVSTSKRPRWSL